MIRKEIASKKLGLQMLKLNILIDFFNKRLKYLRMKSSFDKINIVCIYTITNRLKRIGNKSKIKQIRNKYLKLRVKKLLISIRALIMNKLDVQMKFRNYYMAKNIFEFFKSYKEKEKRHNDLVVRNFISYQFKRKMMNLFKNYFNLVRRQDKILNNLKRFYLKNRKRKLRSIFNDWKKFYICEKYRKFKNFQLKVKIFYSLKFTLLNK